MKSSLQPYRIPVGSLLLLVLMLFIYSCGIKSPTAPNWDVSLNLPLIDTTYSVLDMIKKDSSIVKPDYTKDGLLIYSTVKDVEKIEVSDKLSVDGFSTNTSKEIGSITIDGDSTKADIGFNWSQQGLTPGTQVPILPENNRSVSSDLSTINQFQSAKFESGTINITIKNNFSKDVSLTVNGLTIKNSTTNEIVAQTTTQIVVPPNSTKSFPAVSFNTNVTVKNQLKFETTVSISGSNGNLVPIPQTAFSVTTKFSTLSVSEATAKIPQQNPITIDSSMVMDGTSLQPTKFKTVKIATGTINITLKNNLDVDANVTLEIPNLKNSSNVKFSVSKAVSKKTLTPIKFVDNVSLTDYSLVSLDNNPTNKISYKVTFTSQASTDYRTIKKTDDFLATVDFSALGIKEFDGVVKPTALDETRSAINLDTKDLQQKFGFKQINFNKPLIELHLVPSAGAKINFEINGRLEAQNSLGEKSVLSLNANTMDKSTITEADSVIKLNADSVSAFFKKFSRLPDSIFVFAGGTLNAKYQQVTVNNTSFVSGSSKIEFPLDLGISDGVFTDSVKMDFDADKQKRIRDLNTADMNLVLTNGLAASFTFTGKLYDSSNTFLMYFPHKQADQDTAVTVSGGVTDNSGNVVTKTTQNVTVKLAQGESDLIARAKYMRILVKLNTSRSTNLPVKFKTKDDIRIESFGGVNYHVKP